ncbi:MAG: PhoH family protein [Clostridia bacterium]|jgi:PhoH-like ATPase|nr:PhoH family protein [Clostridia bacterium]
MEKRKIFVLDTCVILHDHAAYKKFAEHDVVIPIAVLEELDNFKKGNEPINYEAREFTRVIDKLSTKDGLNTWVDIDEPGAGKIKVSYLRDTPENSAVKIFHENKPDHRILDVALMQQEKYPDADVILVSKDVNLRVKAKSLSLQAEDYIAGSIRNTDTRFTGKYLLKNAPIEAIDKLYLETDGVPLSEFAESEGFPGEGEILTNTYFIIKNGKKSVIAAYSTVDKCLHHVEKKSSANIMPRNAEQIFAMDAILDNSIKIVSIQGAAGTGKTLIALAAALEQIDDFNEIYVARPIVSLNNKDLGFLPGDVDSKIGPYMDPIWDNLKFIKTQSYTVKKGQKKFDDTTLKDKIVVTPLAFIRGRSLSNVLFIVDEAQNLSPLEMKTIITRIGEGSKIVFTGDVQQIDNPFLSAESCGVSYVIERLKGEPMFAHVTLEKGERSAVATLAAAKL